MILDKEIDIHLNSRNIKHFENLGYAIPVKKDKYGNKKYIKGAKIRVKVEDLKPNSTVALRVKCDYENCEEPIERLMLLSTYNNNLNEDGNYYCHKCANKIFWNRKLVKTKSSKNSKSLEWWCIKNSKQEILELWDYNLNNCSPSEISYGSKLDFYFKCPKNLHKSELKKLNSFTGKLSEIYCKFCNSFAQRGIDNIGVDFLEKYWDYEKNTVDPWNISFGSNQKVWIKCQEKEYHGSYLVQCSSFITRNSRCPYCSTKNGKVHFLDSLGKLLEDKGLLCVWSNLNIKSPYEYTPMSHEKVYWKCLDKKHDDYYREIINSNNADFKCPSCTHYKGEEKISEILLYNNIFYERQMKYDDLLGVGNGKLSYDFYIPEYNFLIEYQGNYHDGTIGKQTDEEFLVQQEHDRRKREYAKNNNITLLEIWYKDFDNIEKILNNQLLFRM